MEGGQTVRGGAVIDQRALRVVRADGVELDFIATGIREVQQADWEYACLGHDDREVHIRRTFAEVSLAERGLRGRWIDEEVIRREGHADRVRGHGCHKWLGA